jgi:hypothetical protein
MANTEEISAEHLALIEALAPQGYSGFRVCGGELCALHDYFTTRAIVVGLDEIGFKRRYCYQDRDEAIRALATWSGQGHPGGNWIKVKGRGIDEMNPLWSSS